VPDGAAPDRAGAGTDGDKSHHTTQALAAATITKSVAA
jgi:hypothetical protein